MIPEKKDKIKDDMRKAAARLWGVQEHEIESSFDPLVMLMIEACAAELEKIGNEISASHTRLLERLVNLILPEAMTGPIPASCVIQSMPVETKATVTPLSLYRTGPVKSISESGSSNIDLHFSPIGTFPIYRARLKYFSAGTSLFQCSESGSRNVVYRGPGTPSNQIWLALEADNGVTELTGMQMFFNMGSHSSAELVYKSLHNSRSQINNNPVTISPGYFNGEYFKINKSTILSSANDLSFKINRKVAYLYENRFMHVTQYRLTEKSRLPDDWANAFPAKLLEDLQKENYIFINLTLDRYFDQSVLDNLSIQINAFPAVNLKLNSISYRTEEWLNIIPLPVEGYFFNIQKIESLNGRPYRFLSTVSTSEISAGEAIVKSTGVGRMTSREVRDLTNLLIESIRDQSAFFAQINNDFILTRLREINQILAGLEDKLSSSADLHSVSQYILLRPIDVGDSLTVHYWTSDGTKAHQLRSNLKLTPVTQNIVDQNLSFLVTSPVGAKDGFSESEKKSLLRQHITTQGKIISASDIQLTCFKIFGEVLDNVVIRKAIHISDLKEEGFKRCIEVTLNIKQDKNAGDPEIENFKREVEYELCQYGSPVYPFHIQVKNI